MNCYFCWQIAELPRQFEGFGRVYLEQVNKLDEIESTLSDILRILEGKRRFYDYE